MDREKHSVFICHDDCDLEVARSIYNDLKNRGLNPWWDRDIIPGQNREDMINKAFGDCQYVIAVLSETSLASTGKFRAQLGKAKKRLEELAGDVVYVIPVKCEPCSPDDWLEALHSIDFRKSPETGLELIRKAMGWHAREAPAEISEKQNPAHVPQELLDGHYFISYSPIDGEEFALRLYDALAGKQVPVWMDQRDARDTGPAWGEQVVRAIETCAGMVFVCTFESVREDADCRAEWMRALKYKKPVIPVLFDSGLELPHRLSGRTKIDFISGELSANAEHLHGHLKRLATPEGRLRMLKDRRSDAQYDLRRTNDQTQRNRIREEIARLDQDIDVQQKIADDPKAAEERARESIRAGLEQERQPEKPAQKECAVKVCQFVNPPPATVPSYFQDRHVETRLVADFLKDPGRCLLTVSGRGGIGKTAMICRVLRFLENGELPDDLGQFPTRGIVYLSAVGSRKIIVPHLFADLCMLLPDDAAGKLDALYREPQVSTERKMSALLDAFPPLRPENKETEHLSGPVLLLLDNFETAVDTETRQITDAELDEAIRTILTHPPHAIKVIITTRIVPRQLSILRPERQMPLPLDEGLASPFAEQILRKMDTSGVFGLKHAPDDLLDKARERTRGYPRALEALFAILSADRDTNLEEILTGAENMLPENVVEVLVGEAFNRLDGPAQKVMQGLAVYGRPVSPTALNYLLEPWFLGTDASPALKRLVNMQFVRKEGGRYYLHPVDRDYALARIPKGKATDREDGNGDTPAFTRFALYNRGAKYFKHARLPRANWKNLDDLKPQLAEFDLRYAGEDYDEAAYVLTDIDYDFLMLWGHFRLMMDLHEKLKGKLENPWLKHSNIGKIGTMYLKFGMIRKGIEYQKRAIVIARESKDKKSEAAWLGNLGLCYSALGQTIKSIEYHKSALKIHCETDNIQGKWTQLCCLGIRYLCLGQSNEAVNYQKRVIEITLKLGDKRGASFGYTELGNVFIYQDEFEKALQKLKQAIN